MTAVERQTARVLPVNRRGQVLLLFGGQDPAGVAHGVPLSNPDLPAVARLAADAMDAARTGTVDTVADMSANGFIPEDFDPPTSLVTDQFRLEPLGPQHNDADRAAWMSSIDHIHATPGYPDGSWPPADGMTSERNLDDLRRHARHFEERVGFTFTVLDPDGDVIGCVYLYPADSAEHDVSVQSWVRVSRVDLDGPLADAVAQWIDDVWPWTSPDRYGR